MLGLDTLDVGIGMALMFLFVSLICSAIREFGESLLKTRASSLEKGIREMLGDSADPANPATVGSLTDQLYNHPMINALFSGAYQTARSRGIVRNIPWLGRNGLPSYIPAENFAKAVIQITRQGSTAADATGILKELSDWATVDANKDKPLAKAIKTALDTAKADITGVQNTAQADLAKTQRAIEQWFNSTMDRVAGWYTRRTAVWLFFLGLGCAVVMNIDAITVMKTLSTDKTLREKVVGEAGELIARCEHDKSQCPQSTDEPAAIAAPTVAASDAAPPSLDHIKQTAQQMNEVAWPIGWSTHWLPAPQERSYVVQNPRPKGSPAIMFPLPDLPTTFGGWVWAPFSFGGWLIHLAWWLLRNEPLVIVGWFITAFGVTFGASFWFDTLNKFMVVRSTVKPDEKSPKEPSKS
jgi:hypothetical protein